MRLVAGLSVSDLAFSFFIFFNYFYQFVSGSPIGNMPGFSTYCQVSNADWGLGSEFGNC